jgi:hypothetical protein
LTCALQAELATYSSLLAIVWTCSGTNRRIGVDARVSEGSRTAVEHDSCITMIIDQVQTAVEHDSRIIKMIVDHVQLEGKALPKAGTSMSPPGNTTSMHHLEKGGIQKLEGQQRLLDIEERRHQLVVFKLGASGKTVAKRHSQVNISEQTRQQYAGYKSTRN